MQQLAKECLEIHEKIKKLSPTRKEKGDKLAKYIKSQLLSNLGEDYEDIDVWCNSCDDYFMMHINIPVKDDVNDYVLICFSECGKLAIHTGSNCRFKEIMDCAQAIVDKLNGKE